MRENAAQPPDDSVVHASPDDAASAAPPRAARRRSVAWTVCAAIFGALLVSLSVGFLGAYADWCERGVHGVGPRTILGYVVGAVGGALLGIGLARGVIGVPVVVVLGCAVSSALVGPGCDLDAVNSLLLGAAIGALIAVARAAVKRQMTEVSDFTPRL